MYNLKPDEWKIIEDKAEQVKNDYNLIGKSFDNMSTNDFKKLEKQINKYKEELELLKLKLEKYEDDKSNKMKEK